VRQVSDLQRRLQRACSILNCLGAVALSPAWAFVLELMLTGASDSVNSNELDVINSSLRAVIA
jgi:hypothetical protein